MDSLNYTLDDSPLSITRMFLRQACALGLTDSPAQPVVPFASITPPRDDATTDPDQRPGVQEPDDIDRPPVARLAEQASVYRYTV